MLNSATHWVIGGAPTLGEKTTKEKEKYNGKEEKEKKMVMGWDEREQGRETPKHVIRERSYINSHIF